MRTAAHGLVRRKRTLVLLINRLFWLRLRLQTLLELRNGGTIKGRRWQNPRLERAAIETGTIAVEALANDLPTANDDGAMAIVKGREFGLSEAEGEERVVAGRHFYI